VLSTAVTSATASIPRALLACIVLMLPALLLATGPFGLTWFGALALYFVVWWTLLFAVLPFRAGDDGSIPLVPGQDPGAPPRPQMRRKALWTTLISDVVFIAAIAAFPLAGL
jgi:predicted secreted protein